MPPRTPDGQPDIQGFWNAVNGSTAQENIEEGSDVEHNAIVGQEVRRLSIIVDPPDQKIPYQPWAAARKKQLYDSRHDPRPEDLDPAAQCFLLGVPRNIYYPFGFQILQPPGYVVIHFEFQHAFRVIPLDGRPHVGGDIKLWMGDSRGRWEGRTLVVDVTNHNGKNRLDWATNFTSDALHVVERWTFTDADTIHYEATLEDPTVYTKPWTMALKLARNKEKGYEQLEQACYEGNKAPELILRDPTR